MRFARYDEPPGQSFGTASLFCGVDFTDAGKAMMDNLRRIGAGGQVDEAAWEDALRHGFQGRP